MPAVHQGQTEEHLRFLHLRYHQCRPYPHTANPACYRHRLYCLPVPAEQRLPAVRQGQTEEHLRFLHLRYHQHRPYPQTASPVCCRHRLYCLLVPVEREQRLPAVHQGQTEEHLRFLRLHYHQPHRYPQTASQACCLRHSALYRSAVPKRSELSYPSAYHQRM